MFLFDKVFYDKGLNFVSGVDEAGRGPLAGPVVAAAVILPKDTYIKDVNDSKKLSEKKRTFLFDIIKEKAIAFNIQVIDNVTIDEINILQSTFLAMKKAVESLSVKPDIVLVDGNHKIPNIKFKQTAIVSGDAKSACIACASILAKVTRDSIMYEYAKQFPQYNFEKHKGYGTKIHIEKIKQFGPCPIHRKTFAPIKNFI
ncbi:MAG: ribonuclease HII [Endomicrobiaceae bacterium]|nr:ribonuclease HII [Endomicrobiaceae bacterium]MDD3053623.1 ribonuclease HII [Endomicrobiaceae bacterium]MDD3922310.1 ribonuclease HII [Endomicrobiaceae bacterium]